MKRHINIPVFIPHEGCPNNCVFCNQHSITQTSEKADRDIKPEIESVLSGIADKDGSEVEIAFFGGSFTGIDRSVMTRLLRDAYEYIKKGEVTSIRLSTRPDFIDEEILGILSEYGVRHIELGIQSMSDSVLAASRRGHTAEISERACELVVKHGFSLTGQMMVGLPGSSVADELYTAERICKMGADSARVYPCVVFYDTPLCEMAHEGLYTPITDREGADRAAECIKVFDRYGVTLLRVGLQSGEGLSPEKVYAGASHSAVGEMAFSKVYLDKLLPLTENAAASVPDAEKTAVYDLVILCGIGETSKVAGQKRENKEKAAECVRAYGIKLRHVKIKECADIEKPHAVRVYLEKIKCK